jgi:hypothetical protein
MDFERINLLLDIIHKSLNVVGMGPIRDAAQTELTKMLTAPDSQPELPLAKPERRV